MLHKGSFAQTLPVLKYLLLIFRSFIILLFLLNWIIDTGYHAFRGQALTFGNSLHPLKALFVLRVVLPGGGQGAGGGWKMVTTHVFIVVQ